MENDRINTVQVENLSVQQADLLAQKLSDEINRLVDETCDKANKILSIYGLETKMQIVIHKKGEQP